MRELRATTHAPNPLQIRKNATSTQEEFTDQARESVHKVQKNVRKISEATKTIVGRNSSKGRKTQMWYSSLS